MGRKGARKAIFLHGEKRPEGGEARRKIGPGVRTGTGKKMVSVSQ